MNRDRCSGCDSRDAELIECNDEKAKLRADLETSKKFHSDEMRNRQQLELQNHELRKVLEEIAKPKYDSTVHGRACPACLARMALFVEKSKSESEIKARLAQIENGNCPECGQKAHLHNCAEKRKESP